MVPSGFSITGGSRLLVILPRPMCRLAWDISSNANEKIADQQLDIQPVIALPALIFQTKIEVEAIDIGNHTLWQFI